MRIYSPDGQDFDTAGTRMFSEHDLMSVHEGNVVPVTFTPANPSQVSFHSEARLLDAQELHGRVRKELGLTDPREAETFATNGIRTTGTVTNHRLTARTHYGHSELLVTVQFVRGDGCAVERTKIVWLMPTWFNAMDIGSEVADTYLPFDDSQLIATAGASG